MATNVSKLQEAEVEVEEAVAGEAVVAAEAVVGEGDDSQYKCINATL